MTIASIVASSSLVSWTLAPAIATPSGPPLCSTITLFLVLTFVVMMCAYAVDVAAVAVAAAMIGARGLQLVDGNPERPGRVVEVESGALEQLVGDQAGARVAAGVAFVVGAGEKAGGSGSPGGRLASSSARKKRWAVHAATVWPR